MREELKPCPFCGSTNISSGEAAGRDINGQVCQQTGCLDCGSLGPEAPYPDTYDHSQADAAWNKQTALTAANERIRELTDAFEDAENRIIELREVSDKLETALKEAVDREDNPRFGVFDRASHVVAPLRKALAEVAAIRAKQGSN